MTRYAILSIALLAAAPAAAAAQQKGQAEASQPSSGTPSPKLQNLIQNCDAHKFETTVTSSIDGKPHDSKVKLCGNEGQTEAEWIGTLQDAIAKLTADKDMPIAMREQIITAIKAEVARLEGAVTDLSPGGELPPGRSIGGSKPLSNDYSVLPPLTAAPSPPRLLAPSAAATGSKSADASPVSDSAAATSPPPATPSVPEPAAAALIDNAPAAPPVVAAPPAPKPALVTKPRLTFECIGSDFPGGGPCISLSRDTILAVKAGESLANDVSLRFVRKGDARAEVSLGSMNKGQSVRLQVPREVCSGVVSSEIDIEVTRGGQVVDRQGPYLLRC